MFSIQRESKRQKTKGGQEKVLYVTTKHRLIGIDLDEFKRVSKSYERGSGNFQTPEFFCHIDYVARKLPLSMSAIPSSSGQEIYLIGGEYYEEECDGRLRFNISRWYYVENLSSQVYKFDPSSKGYVPPEPVGLMCAPKTRPLVETLDGKTYALGRMARFGGCFHHYPYPSPILELLDLSLVESSDDPNRVIGVGIDDELLQVPGQCVFEEVSGYYVIGSRMFLYLSFDVDVNNHMSCYDAKLGDWLTEEEGIDLDVVLKSFSSVDLFPLAGRTVSIARLSNDDVDADASCADGVVAIGEDGDRLFVLLFTSPADLEFGYVRYFAGIVNESGTLLCYQDITEKIFIASKMPYKLRYAQCQFVDVGGSRIYAVVSGSGVDPLPDGTCTSRTVLCLSQFTIHMSSDMGQIVSEVRRGSKSKETEFVFISSVETFICSHTDDRDFDINTAFFL